MKGLVYVIGMILGLALILICHLLVGALLVLVAILCFGFAFKWIYAVGVALILMILLPIFKSHSN